MPLFILIFGQGAEVRLYGHFRKMKIFSCCNSVLIGWCILNNSHCMVHRAQCIVRSKLNIVHRQMSIVHIKGWNVPDILSGQ